MKKKLKNKLSAFLLFVGLLALGIFLLTSFGSVYKLLMEYKITVLWVSGGVVAILTIADILKPKTVKGSIWGGIKRCLA